MDKAELESSNGNATKTPNKNEPLITIDNSDYTYSISKLENEEGIIIKLVESNPKTNIFYTYEALTEQLIKDIKILYTCESIEEMILSLKEVFSNGKVKVENKEGKYLLELLFEGFGKAKKSVIELKKNEPKDPFTQINDRIKAIEEKLEDISKKIETIQNQKSSNNSSSNLKELVKQILLDKEFKQILLNEHHLINNEKEKGETKDKNTKSKNVSCEISKESKENNESISCSKKLIDLKKEIDNIKSDLKDLKKSNYIIIHLSCKENSNITLLSQVQSYKNNFNFERDDVEFIINDEIVPIQYMEEKKNIYESQKKGGIPYDFYWHFKKGENYIVKIIFRKKLYDCSYMFSKSGSYITFMDLSNFDCSEVTSCAFMFYKLSAMEKINLGNLDFACSNNFESMFENCGALLELDVSHFNTKNSKSFKKMFNGCCKLKVIDVSKFNTSKCENIEGMFNLCYNVKEINMIDWDMSDITNMEGLFTCCQNLKKLKMNCNFESSIKNKYIFFFGLLGEGEFKWKKGSNYKEILDCLPNSWQRSEE